MIQRGPGGPSSALWGSAQSSMGRWASSTTQTTGHRKNLAGGLRTAHVSLLWEGLERSVQEALSNLWLGQGLFRAPK